MTDKEIVERLDKILDNSNTMAEQIFLLRDTLDPPRPVPGTVVWWRYYGGVGWRIGEVNHSSSGIRGLYWNSSPIYWDEIEYKPARILGPGEVVVKVPPVSEWPGGSKGIVWNWSWRTTADQLADFLVTTRAEAERMEADQ